MRQLIHNGVLVPKYEWKRLRISVKGIEVELTPEQEEMASAWAKKLETDYVKDKVFARNFFADFRKKLIIKDSLKPEDFDFSKAQEFVEAERIARLNMSKEEKKRLSEQRKAIREFNRQKYGYAIVDGTRTEISNYTAEPSCIFMGRGRHPLRGRWKEGPREEGIELNLSPGAPRPEGNWKKILWQPEVMWIARWQDKLTGKMRYVWLSENSALKQEKDIEKFDKATILQQNLARVRRHIWENLDSEDLRRRKTATVCFLIDKLKIRVGDEKDPDEADTVGASTLRPQHIEFGEDGDVIFNFLGKDSVPQIFKVRLPEKVVRNLKGFSANAESALFEGVDSQRVSEFLDEVVGGLSAKVFRTCYASEAVKIKLESTQVKVEAPDYVKRYVATMANLEAAKVCNHRRTVSKTWRSSLRKGETRLSELIRAAKEGKKKMRQKAEKKEEQQTRRLRKMEERFNAMMKELQDYQQEAAERRREGKPVAALERRMNVKRRAITRQRQRIKETKAQYEGRKGKLKERLERRVKRDSMIVEKLGLQIRAKKETRDYNLATSLKSYIDPLIYYHWARQVRYDWKLYYPKTLQRKFSWVEETQQARYEKS